MGLNIRILLPSIHIRHGFIVLVAANAMRCCTAAMVDACLTIDTPNEGVELARFAALGIER